VRTTTKSDGVRVAEKQKIYAELTSGDRHLPPVVVESESRTRLGLFVAYSPRGAASTESEPTISGGIVKGWCRVERQSGTKCEHALVFANPHELFFEGSRRN
jgi:hypothetical protein